jgi:hypothetical protein
VICVDLERLAGKGDSDRRTGFHGQPNQFLADLVGGFAWQRAPLPRQ